MPYLLDNDPSSSELSEAVNYLLCNFDTSISSDANTGEVKGPTGAILGYLYKYMAIKYADSFDGSVNFSNSPTNRGYFGIRNSNDLTESTNYTDYIWNKVTGGFGTTKFLYYLTTGGRQIQFSVATTAPDGGWLVDPGTPIDLDVITSTSIVSFTAYFSPNVYQVPRAGGPLAPVFTGITPALYATNKGVIVQFSSGQTDSASTFVNNSWRIGASATTGNADIMYTNITIGSPSVYGDHALWPTPTAMSSSPAYMAVPIRYKTSAGVVIQSVVLSTQFLFSDPGADGSPGATGATGATGASGTKSITVSAFQWATSSPGVPSQAFTYTWNTGSISAYPTGWTAAASTAPATGYVLYQLNLVITDTATATTTSTNWSGGSIGSIGYRQDGSIGPQGDGARLAYTKSTIASPAGTTTSTGSTSLPATGSFGLTGSSFSTSPPTLTTSGEFLYQTDGIYVVSTNTISWSTPYLSNLKVGSLSAISANLGIVNIATAGNLNSGKTSYSDTTAGFFLGNDSGTPRLSIGNSTNSLQWTGSALNINGNIYSGKTSYTDPTAGFFLGYSGTTPVISIGTSTSYFSFDGSSVTIGGNINTTGYAIISGSTTVGSYNAAGHFNGSGSATNGLIAYAGSTGSALIGISTGTGNGINVSSNTGTAAVVGSSSGIGLQASNTSSTYPSGFFYNGSSGKAVSMFCSGGVPLDIYGGTSSAPMTLNSTVLVSNLNAEYWAGVKGVTSVANGSVGVLPIAYPPVTLTYNQVKYLQIDVGGITGYIPVYI